MSDVIVIVIVIVIEEWPSISWMPFSPAGADRASQGRSTVTEAVEPDRRKRCQAQDRGWHPMQ
ncbi:MULTISPECIES: hypothetical protein [Streptomyces]|uniref:hypothetical protein n=1 Tax=Streptomyces TaxID=1883 RepID=UPI00386AF9BE|nr:hypothetical protein OHB50_14920 [Streptomyces anulatus]